MKTYIYPCLLALSLLICSQAPGQTFFQAMAVSKETAARKNINKLRLKIPPNDFRSFNVLSKKNGSVNSYFEKIDTALIRQYIYANAGEKISSISGVPIDSALIFHLNDFSVKTNSGLEKPFVISDLPTIQRFVEIFLLKNKTFLKPIGLNKIKDEDFNTYNTNLNDLNAVSPFEFYTTFGLNTTGNGIEQPVGAGAFGGRARLSEHKTGKKGWLDPHYLYLEYRFRSAKSADSTAFRKTFIFPELNRSDFIIGYYWEIEKYGWHLAPRFEFSLNRYSDTSKTYFESQSVQAGYRVTKQVTPNVNNWVMLDLYYNFIHVDPKFGGDYRILIQEKESPLAFHTIGFTAALGPQNAAVFCNMKYILNGGNKIQNTDMTGLVYTIGVKALISTNNILTR